MNIKKIFIVLIFSMTAAQTLPSSAQSSKKNAEWLIFDGTKNYSYAMAQYLLSQGHACTLITKPEDMVHADLRFCADNRPDIVTLDYTQTDKATRAALVQAARGHRFVLLDPEHGDFTTWHSTVINIATNALITARTCNLTVCYPGKVYPFSNTPTITEKSPYQPETEQGKTLAKVEK